jgi:hypothetical protein
MHNIVVLVFVSFVLTFSHSLIVLRHANAGVVVSHSRNEKDRSRVLCQSHSSDVKDRFGWITTTTTDTKNSLLSAVTSAIIVGTSLGVATPLPIYASSIPSTMTSSIVTAADVKVMDMSLPSYSSISDPKSADLDSLKKDPPKDLMMGVSARKEKTTKNKKKQKEVTTATPKESTKEDKGPVYEIVDMTLPSYDENTVGKGKEAFLI